MLCNLFRSLVFLSFYFTLQRFERFTQIVAFSPFDIRFCKTYGLDGTAYFYGWRFKTAKMVLTMVTEFHFLLSGRPLLLILLLLWVHGISAPGFTEVMKTRMAFIIFSFVFLEGKGRKGLARCISESHTYKGYTGLAWRDGGVPLRKRVIDRADRLDGLFFSKKRLTKMERVILGKELMRGYSFLTEVRLLAGGRADISGESYDV